MKKLLIALFLCGTLLACSKSGNNNNNNDDDHISASQVPASVMTSFNTRYPAASGQIEWELEHGNTYKVKYFIGSQRWQAQFNSNGSFIDEKKI